MFKLLLFWDIQPGRERPYEEFMVGDFLPALNSLGLEMNEVWLSLYGEGSQLLLGFSIDDKERLTSILRSSKWHSLHVKLESFVTNYRQKVVADNGNFFQL